MGYFSVRVMYCNNQPASDVGVMIEYDWMGVCDEKRTHSDGWFEFHNRENKSGTIWIRGQSIGNHSLSNGKTYSFTI